MQKLGAKSFAGVQGHRGFRVSKRHPYGSRWGFSSARGDSLALPRCVWPIGRPLLRGLSLSPISHWLTPSTSHTYQQRLVHTVPDSRPIGPHTLPQFVRPRTQYLVDAEEDVRNPRQNAHNSSSTQASLPFEETIYDKIPGSIVHPIMELPEASIRGGITRLNVGIRCRGCSQTLFYRCR